ncbi:MAG TPA: hypothetical protein VFA18_08775 [Gemmataceae bacterium]|nr:hypothetical protein [Gemmataceae bacterium]
MRVQIFFESLTLTATSRRPIRRHAPAAGLSVEALEDRCLPSFSPARPPRLSQNLSHLRHRLNGQRPRQRQHQSRRHYYPP